MTEKWQFPAWEDMQEIDVCKPLVTRLGLPVCDIRSLQRGVYNYCADESRCTWVHVDSRGRYHAAAPHLDIQNPPEWAYAQYGIEPPEFEITMSVAIQSAAASVEFVDQLAAEPCRAPSYDCWDGKDTPCGKCASCRARAITGDEMPQLRRRGDGTSYRCQHCGQSEV